jgi:hypothetical protein
VENLKGNPDGKRLYRTQPTEKIQNATKNERYRDKIRQQNNKKMPKKNETNLGYIHTKTCMERHDSEVPDINKNNTIPAHH